MPLDLRRRAVDVGRAVLAVVIVVGWPLTCFTLANLDLLPLGRWPYASAVLVGAWEAFEWIVRAVLSAAAFHLGRQCAHARALGWWLAAAFAVALVAAWNADRQIGPRGADAVRAFCYSVLVLAVPLLTGWGMRPPRPPVGQGVTRAQGTPAAVAPGP